ncbi:MAG: TonB-dependent receptor domain-containing protein [Blastocatellia bacterium]
MFAFCMICKLCGRPLAALLLLPILLSHISAQSFTATLTGRIKDEAGAVMPGVVVTLTHTGTNRSFAGQSNEDGFYLVTNLPVGEYQLTVGHPGFKKFVQSGITLEVDQAARLDVKLEVGAVTEAVQITAEPPLLNTENGARGQVITNQEIVDLPLNGRDFNELAYLSPGVVPVAQGGQGGFGSINGARADSLNFVVDGINNQNIRGGAAQVRPSVDAIQEFKVQTNAYAADFGRVSSGVINLALKSGTNQFHGSLFEFVRNDIFDARNFFDGDEKSKLRRNQFGGTIGGPVWLPKSAFEPAAYDGHDQTFFFFSYEGSRVRQGVTRLGRVPALAERAGDFSAYSDNLVDPTVATTCRFPTNTATCLFPGKKIPANRFSPIALKVLEFYPLPNRAGASNYVASKSDNDNQNSYVVKFDQKLRQSDTLSVSYIRTRQNNTDPFSGSIFPGFAHLTDVKQQQYGIRFTQVYRPTWTNEFRFGFGRTKNDQHSEAFEADYAAQLGIPGVTSNPQLLGFPRFTVSTLDALGEGASQPLDFVVNNFQFYDTMSVIKGRHFMRFGADIIRTQFFQLYANNNRGTFNFLGRWTGQPVGDLLLGLLESATRQVGINKNYLFSTTYGFFIQDDFKASSRLTLNLGLRYDLLALPYEKFNGMTNFVPEVGRIVRAGEAGFPRSLVELDKTNWSPRFGFALRMTRNNKWVMRGGYGIFYNFTIQNPIRTQLANNYPFATFQRFNRQASTPTLLTLATPFPDQILRLEGVNTPNGVEFGAPTPYLQQYNLTIEHELARGLTAEVAYVGSKGTHLGRSYNINQATRTATAVGPVPYAGFGTIDYLGFGSMSSYHAFQATVRKRLQRGLSFRANFIFSKSIDDASQVSDASDGGFGGAQDARDLRGERGLSDFDRRKVFTFDMTYALPFGRGKAFLNRKDGWNTVFGNWQFNALVRLMDGQPFTVQLANFNYGLGESKRPDRIGSGQLDNPTPDKWFRVEDFVAVPRGAYRFGNSGRNILAGPGRRLVDLSLFKDFRFKDQQRFQVRFEVFNAINAANFRLPVRNIDVPNAAAVTGASGGREIQFGLKYLF